MSSKSNEIEPRVPLTSRRIAFLRPVAKRVASKVARAPPLIRDTSTAASSTVTSPVAVAPAAAVPPIPPRSRRPGIGAGGAARARTSR